MGQEERKNKAKMEKTQIQLATTSNEYEAVVKALEETTGRWNRDWKAACDVRQSSPVWGIRLTGERNSKILKKKDLTLQRAAYGPLRMLLRQYVSAMMRRVKRFVWPSRAARLRRILPASSRRGEPAKKFLIHQSTSTFVAETSMILHQKRRRMRTTRWPSFNEQSILRSEAHLPNHLFWNLIMTLDRIWRSKWATWKRIRRPAAKRPWRHRRQCSNPLQW